MVTAPRWAHMKNKLIPILVTTIAMVSVADVAALNLTIPANVLGKVNPGTPAGDDFSLEQIRFLADKHNIPTAPGNLGDNPADPNDEVYTLVTQFGFQLNESISLSFKSDSGDNTLSGLGSYEYVLAKYGNDVVIWYIGNLVQDGSVEVPSSYTETEIVVNPNNGKIQERTTFGGGLSHLSFYNELQRVPDAGATAILLGSGLMGLAALRRRIGR